MSLPDSPFPFSSETPDKALLAAYALEQGVLESCRERLGHMEQEILRRMKERDAIGIPDETYICELRQVNTYDGVRLTPLLELLTTVDLETVYTPEQQQTVLVAPKWNTVKLLALARRYGGEALRIVEGAKLPGAPQLKFRRRGE